MTRINQASFSGLGEAMAFYTALEADGHQAWLSDYHMNAYWSGLQGAMGGFRVSWLGDGRPEPVASSEVTDDALPEQGETFSSVFGSRFRRRALFGVLFLIVVNPMPSHHSIADGLWAYSISHPSSYVSYSAESLCPGEMVPLNAELRSMYRDFGVPDDQMPETFCMISAPDS